MDPITLIVTALAAGAAAGLQDGVKDTVKDGYFKLKEAVKRRLAGNPAGEIALERYESAPEAWQGALSAELTEAGAADDSDLIDAAKALKDLLDGAGAAAGKYNVSISGGVKGAQFGDGNRQTNNFG